MTPENLPVQVIVTQNFSASAERVCDAWLDATLIGQWMFGARLRDEEIVSITTDPRVGGRFNFVVKRQGNLIDHTGTYQAVDRPRHLAFTWSVAGHSDDAESLVTIDIEPQETGCRLTLTHTMNPKWADFAERTKAGWAKMLDVLEDVLREKRV